MLCQSTIKCQQCILGNRRSPISRKRSILNDCIQIGISLIRCHFIRSYYRKAAKHLFHIITVQLLKGYRQLMPLGIPCGGILYFIRIIFYFARNINIIQGNRPQLITRIRGEGKQNILSFFNGYGAVRRYLPPAACAYIDCIKRCRSSLKGHFSGSSAVIDFILGSKCPGIFLFPFLNSLILIPHNITGSTAFAQAQIGELTIHRYRS